MSTDSQYVLPLRVDLTNFKRPLLPKKIPSIQCSSASLDTTWVHSCPDEQDLSSTLWTCAFCLGVPRQPCMLCTCTHVACHNCLLTNLKHNAAANDSDSVTYRARNTTPCPLCRKPYSEEAILQFHRWDLLAKASYNMIKIRCPADTCFFIGNIRELLIHEKFECCKRQIECPNIYCEYRGTENEVRNHFEICENLRIRCTACELPLIWMTRRTHDCYATMKRALNSKSIL